MRKKTLLGAFGVALFLGVPAFAQDPECGGIAALQCKTGFCELQAGTCMIADAGGMCAKAPEVCTEDERPVCGCDRTTYGNDCKRRMAKVSKDHDGRCIKE